MPKRKISNGAEEVIQSSTSKLNSSRVSIPPKKFSTTSSKVISTPTVHSERQPPPTRNEKGQLVFPDYPTFTPNLSPKQVMALGSFGGTYFRPIHSKVTGKDYDATVYKEFPTEWFEDLDIGKQVTSSVYRKELNRYKESCGGDLDMWESSGWITNIDPYGWFQWYCRFYLGRRSSDDDRQVARGLGVFGPKGRWRMNLINKCLKSGKSMEKAVDDFSISPKIRQLLQHWGYQLTLEDLKSASK